MSQAGEADDAWAMHRRATRPAGRTTACRHSHSWGIEEEVGLCMGWCIPRTDSLQVMVHQHVGGHRHQGIHQRRREGREIFSPAGMRREMRQQRVVPCWREA